MRSEGEIASVLQDALRTHAPEVPVRLVLFSTSPSSSPRPGVLDGETIRPLEGLDSLDAFVALPPDERAAAATRLGPRTRREYVTLHAPLHPHKNVFCVGRNYLAHAEEGARARGEALTLPAVPTFFSKAPTAIADPDATLHLSAAVSEQYDWEAELAVVIGTRCKDVPEDRALDVVFGYTCLNDVSARDVQKATTQWFKGKTLDDTCPLGPWLVTADEIGDPQQLDVSLRVNGETKQHANTASMIFSVARCIAELSKGTTLEPGDVIATGTPEGVGFARTPPEFLKDGDVMDVEISKIGVLRNTVALTAPVGARA
ncbi:MAG: fumarylacetoacetate hydrolase family protein [Candidatus Eremiobacteraeota bacterium]|nr:fumarylacetoacetate hydrolase family protein [Candidatus Eremiobacteraeota bacterium]